MVNAVESYVELVLNALDHPEAMVTDLSTIDNFGLDDDERGVATARLGVKLSDDNYVYEVAQRFLDEARGR